MNTLNIIEKLKTENTASREELIFLIKNISDSEREELRRAAQELTLKIFGSKIYIRGLVELSSLCKNDCF